MMEEMKRILYNASREIAKIQVMFSLSSLITFGYPFCPIHLQGTVKQLGWFQRGLSIPKIYNTYLPYEITILARSLKLFLRLLLLGKFAYTLTTGSPQCRIYIKLWILVCATFDS